MENNKFKNMKTSELLDSAPRLGTTEFDVWFEEINSRIPFNILFPEVMTQRIEKLETRLKTHRHETSKLFTGRAEY